MSGYPGPRLDPKREMVLSKRVRKVFALGFPGVLGAVNVTVAGLARSVLEARLHRDVSPCGTVSNVGLCRGEAMGARLAVEGLLESESEGMLGWCAKLGRWICDGVLLSDELVWVRAGVGRND